MVMVITIESKAKPCPGVQRAIQLTEDVLKKRDEIFSIGQLIHNRREIERLHKMGLRCQNSSLFTSRSTNNGVNGAYFLVRTHGESADVLQEVNKRGYQILDATCPIVRHSQEIVDQHVREGWRIVIAGNKEHPEVQGLLTRTRGTGMVVSSQQEVENQAVQEHTLLLAQTTIDPNLFVKVHNILSRRISDLKIVDTTCQYLRHRQNDIKSFSAKQDVLLIVGGKTSANCQLLYHTAKEINTRTYKIEGPEEIVLEWFQDGDKVGISGGASTPFWQLEEARKYLECMLIENNPKG